MSSDRRGTAEPSSRLPASAYALRWLRRHRGYTQEEAAKVTGVATYRHYEHTRPLRDHALQRIIAGFALIDEEIAPLAEAADRGRPVVDCLSEAPEQLGDLGGFIDSLSVPAYVTGPWWQVVHSNAAAGEWLSPLLEPDAPQTIGRNALSMLFAEQRRVASRDGSEWENGKQAFPEPSQERQEYLDSFICAYKATWLRHCSHQPCRGGLDAVVAHLSATNDYWARRWDEVPAREWGNAATTWTLTPRWNSMPGHRWYDPDRELVYRVSALITEPWTPLARTDYRVNIVSVPGLGTPDAPCPEPVAWRPRGT
ncbi:helix-turn-helix domain-containing protein [Yinghuangia seranimata]|uniref:helix-turn-helix domain-containing protein n=1 Tax=Yinghuangia seranimata TaxID=408067 RepID=UPI00248B5FFE|nr:helix-turn-helix transcriptional regulator [Yinghuangia seranimata]MDI2129603.1 helix-turn-helix transcriptional regulator [Yinghuangia seranimata]